MSEQQFDDFLESAKTALDELGPGASEEGDFLKLDDGKEINVEFRLDKAAHAVEKPPFKEGDQPRKQMRFYVWEIDDKGNQLRKLVWDASKRDSNTVYRIINDKKISKLVIRRDGVSTNTKYTIYPYHPA